MSLIKTLIPSIGFGLFAVVATASFGQAEAAGANFCKRYAKNAVKHYNKNVQLGCGFAGLEWHTWKAGHRQWCRATPRGIVQIGHDNRVAQLSRCQQQAGNAPQRPQPNRVCKKKHVSSVKLLPTKAIAAANAWVKADRKIRTQCRSGKVTNYFGTKMGGRGYLGTANYTCCN